MSGIAPDSTCCGRPQCTSFLTIGDVAHLLGVSDQELDVRLTPERLVSGVSLDSRQVAPGDVYVASPGECFHGIEFVEEAARRGAVAVVSDVYTEILPALLVPQPRAVLGQLSAAVYGEPSRALDVFGVTGTNGKTSVAYLLDAALAAGGHTTGLITGVSVRGPQTRRIGSRTTPEAPELQQTLALFREQGVGAVAMEVSSHGLAFGRVDGTYLRAAVFTNLSPDHLDFHSSMEDYYRVKASLFTADRSGLGVVNIDDDYGRRLLSEIGIAAVSVSTTDPTADFYGCDVYADGAGTSFTLHSPYGRFPVRLKLLGEPQADNALAAIAAVSVTGGDVSAAVGGVSTLEKIPGRMERVDVGQPFLAFVDYMHNTAGQHRIYPFLRSLTERRVIAVIGATGDRDPGKRAPLGFTAARVADVVIITDESPFSEDPDALRSEVVRGAQAAGRAEVLVQPDRALAIELAVNIAEKGDVLVVAGRGHTATLVSGERAERFDDRTVVRDAILNLERHSYTQLPTEGNGRQL